MYDVYLPMYVSIYYIFSLKTVQQYSNAVMYYTSNSYVLLIFVCFLTDVIMLSQCYINSINSINDNVLLHYTINIIVRAEVKRELSRDRVLEPVTSWALFGWRVEEKPMTPRVVLLLLNSITYYHIGRIRNSRIHRIFKKSSYTHSYSRCRHYATAVYYRVG